MDNPVENSARAKGGPRTLFVHRDVIDSYIDYALERRKILYDATGHNVEYVFADSVTSVSDDGRVTFENAEPRDFDVIVGADGLHSNVRTLTFGPESGFSTWIGGYLSVISVPEYLAFNGVMQVTAKVGNPSTAWAGPPGSARRPTRR